MSESFGKLAFKIENGEANEKEMAQQKISPKKPAEEERLSESLDVSGSADSRESSSHNELENPESEMEQFEKNSEIAPAENKEPQVKDSAMEMENLESEVAQAERALEAAYAEDGESTVESSTNEMENPESSPEFQAYVEEMKAQMEKEFEGMGSFDRNAEATERPKRHALRKAMLIATAGVMLWMASAATAPNTAEAKSGIRVENIFDTKRTAKRLEKQKKREIRKFEKNIEKSGRIIIKGTTKGVSDTINNSVKEVLRNIFN